MWQIEFTGWEEAAEILKWADDNAEEVMAYYLKRLAIEFMEMVGPSPYLHLVKIKTPDAGYAYGVSLEPEPKQSSLEALSGGLLYFATGDEAIGYYEHPYVSTHVPERLITESPEDGMFYVRDASAEELAEWAKRNSEYIEAEGIEVAPLDSMVWFVEDVAYNTVRSEFGFGDNKGPKTWRNSFQKLKDRVAQKVAKEIEKSILEMKLSEVPSFEERPYEWLEKNQRAMLALAGG